MEIFRKGTVSAEFWANRPKLCGNCAFPKNFHTRKLGEITVFYAALSFILPLAIAERRESDREKKKEIQMIYLAESGDERERTSFLFKN